MAARAKSILGHNEFTELADKGYHTGEEIRKCHEAGIETLVAIPKTPVSSQAPDPAYNQDKFSTIRRMTFTCVRKATSSLPTVPGIRTILIKPSSIKQNPARVAL
ncbi:MAG: hypothetical protein V1733_04385 [bacterium]